MAEHSLKGGGPALCLPRVTRSPSPSRSPEKKPKFYAHVLDPLLSNLSPDATLNALSTVDGVRGAQQSTHDTLAKTISNASPSERAFGVRAALAAQKLKDWYKEVQPWQWVGKRDAGLGKGFFCPADGDSEKCKGHLGSLPADLVDRYGSRIEEIRDDMETLDVEELKEHVLDQHIPARSRPGSTSSAISNLDVPLSYSQLSDFSALITATILHALPVLSRLNILLQRWSIRLRVVRLIPALRSGLLNSLSLVESALDQIDKGLLPDSDDALFSKEAFCATRSKLEAHVSLSGSQMDNILDALEGHEDSLPESWIDEMEAIESGFATWAAQAEKKAFQNEWIPKLKPDDPATAKSNGSPHEDEKTESNSEHPAIEGRESPTGANAEDAETLVLPENMGERTSKSARVSSQENEDLTQKVHLPSDEPDQEPPKAASTAHLGLDMNGMDESTVISDYDLTQSHLTVSSSISSIPSQLDQDENHAHAAPESFNGLRNKEQPTQKLHEKHGDMVSGEQSDDDTSGQSMSSVSGAENGVEPRIEIVDTSHEVEFDLQRSVDHADERDASAASMDAQKASDGDTEYRTENLAGSFSSDENIPRSGSIDSVQSAASSSSEAMSVPSNAKLEDPEFQRRSSAVATPNHSRQSDSESPFQQTPIATEAQTPGTARRDSYPRLNRSISLPPDGPVEQGINHQNGEDQVQHDDSHEVRQASTVSIEELSRSKLRSVMVGSNKAKSLPNRRPEPLTLRRSFSSASLTLPEPDETEEDQLSGNRDLHEGVSQSPRRLNPTSPALLPDSPTSPVSPLTVNKRSKVRNSHESNASGRKPPQLKRLRPSPVITSGKRSTNPAHSSNAKSSEDQLDEKISSILTTLPGRIHLASSKDSSESDGLRRASQNENLRSASPASTRSSTPTPSFTLTPALRSRRSLGAQDDSSVKLYHLQGVGKSAPVKPIKLFVRSVGEDGERVMVRVGGGWADLREYLREYVVHHGRRKVTEERFEIKGLPPRNGSSNTYSSGRLTPQPASNTGRTTPNPRSGSALDMRRPSSSLSVRKTRRLTATEADLPPFSPVNFQASDQSETPLSAKQRRQSVASSVSADGPSTPPSGTRSTSTPLGLAGPKPRSRGVSMSPESEAWVEGVMGEARKKTQTLKHQFSSGTLRNLPPVAENDPKAGPKLRSVSDIGGGTTNRKAHLRGVNK